MEEILDLHRGYLASGGVAATADAGAWAVCRRAMSAPSGTAATKVTAISVTGNLSMRGL